MRLPYETAESIVDIAPSVIFSSGLEANDNSYTSFGELMNALGW